jgi:hypothetical protein
MPLAASKIRSSSLLTADLLPFVPGGGAAFFCEPSPWMMIDNNLPCVREADRAAANDRMFVVPFVSHLGGESMFENSKWVKSALGSGLMAAAFGIGIPAEQATADYLSEIASQTPLLYWQMNESVITNPFPAAIDNLDPLLGVGNFTNSGNVGANTVVGVASMTPGSGFLGFGAGNTAYNFNNSGAGSVITNLTLPRQSMTMAGSSVSMWVKSTNPNDGGTMNGTLWRGDEGDGHNLNLRLTDDGNGNGTFTLNLETGEVVTLANGTDGSIDYSDGQWHHVAATWDYDINTDSGNLNVYVDGGTLAGGEQVSLAFSSATYAPIIFEPDPVNFPGVFEVMDFDFRNRLGKGRVNAHRYNGEMDEAAIWNRTLSAQEVADQYAAAFVPEPASIALLAGAIGFVGQRRHKRS